ncbi:hypothetical protein E2C01_018371 [Portunus trituberculatus]|uniref:Uncharacterized protein n=1 Tax=Portunus trituberculatus TaxID=210409 RepID=A0A5B7DVY7_PORTR|nr:hypothetical protein [Portunus trituberculatus]
MRIPCQTDCREWERENKGEESLFLAVTTMRERARATSSSRELCAFSQPFCSHPDTCHRNTRQSKHKESDPPESLVPWACETTVPKHWQPGTAHDSSSSSSGRRQSCSIRVLEAD